MKESFKKIWTDSVWSKVISVIIIGIFSYTAVFIGKYFLSDCQKLALIESFEKILKIKISIIYIPAILIANWIFFWLFKKIFKKEKPQYNSKQQELMKFNEISVIEMGLLFRWDVSFYNGNPLIVNFTMYCTKHEVPLRFMYDRCQMSGCVNSRQQLDKNGVMNIAESAVIERWKELK